ncbi:hypothetical protein HGRIS_012412 [Hohenbuehelia grisea]|uniref:Uncharacterized protein n=1 Tax=Hohenbuehelia grisea TaxID=104357 RepID=A0ABR3IS89_9AGAR
MYRHPKPLPGFRTAANPATSAPGLPESPFVAKSSICAPPVVEMRPRHKAFSRSVDLKLPSDILDSSNPPLRRKSAVDVMDPRPSDSGFQAHRARRATMVSDKGLAIDTRHAGANRFEWIAPKTAIGSTSRFPELN